jgi:hypothetical protein
MLRFGNMREELETFFAELSACRRERCQRHAPRAPKNDLRCQETSGRLWVCQ